jgi:hypothetical protein
MAAQEQEKTCAERIGLDRALEQAGFPAKQSDKKCYYQEPDLVEKRKKKWAVAVQQQVGAVRTANPFRRGKYECVKNLLNWERS